MKFVAFIFFFLMGGIVTAYSPLGDYFPETEKVIISARNAAPFLADWLPDMSADVDADSSGQTLLSQTPTTQVADIVNELSDQELTWGRFASEDIETLLTEMGLPQERLALETGESYIAVAREESFTFYLRPRLCEQSGDCIGLQLFSTFAADLSREQLAELNETYVFVKFYTDADGYLVLENYLSTEYGVSRDNIKANIEMFVSVLDSFSLSIEDTFSASIENESSS